MIKSNGVSPSRVHHAKSLHANIHKQKIVSAYVLMLQNYVDRNVETDATYIHLLRDV